MVTPQMGHENPRISPELDELFDQFFDWPGFSGETNLIDSPAHHHSPPTLSKLITQIPAVLEALPYDWENEYSIRMAPYQSDDEAVTSDYSGQTPPDLIQGGSTSPSDHSGSPFLEPVDEGHHHSDASLREFQAQDDEWTYPQKDPSKGVVQGYPSRLQVQEDQTKRTADLSSGLKRRRSGNDLEKRHRQLADPGLTADVRKTGACLPCRVSKTRCHDSGVCPTCRKAFPDHSHLACTRASPSMFWPVMGKIPDVWSGRAKEEEQICSGPRFYTGKPRDISVFFSRDTKQPFMRATVQAYRSQGGSEETGSLSMADFPRDCVPSHQMLVMWAEQQICQEHQPDFQNAVQSFLLAYSKEPSSLPKHGLVSKVHRMNCFFRIWKTPSFWCLDPSNNHVALPLSVQAQLRNIARRGLYSLEHDILKELDECLAQQGPPKPQERMAIWASLWQLILMYRELLNAFEFHLDRIDKDNSEPAQTVNAQKDLRKRLADAFFPLLTVFYHYQFRTKKSLELSLDWLKVSSYPAVCQGKGIHEIAQQLLGSRKELYQGLQSSDNDIDRLLCVFVVNHELKKMNARKRPSKASAKSKNAVEDDCDDDAE